ncbi:hypothetical protein ES705_07733 [subsurface metagenome]
MYWLLRVIVSAVVVAIIYFSIKKDVSSGYEEGKKQFEEDNFLGQYYGKKVGKKTNK